MKSLSSEELTDDIKKKFKIKDIVIEKKLSGLKKRETVTIWVKGNREHLRDFVRYLISIEYPHLAVVSGSDLGEKIELIYHFTLYYGKKHSEILINYSIDIPKDDLTVPTICDLIPGALVTEREKQEMLGIRVEGIPDNRRIFLPDDFPKDVYPWRRDEKGPDKMVRDLYEVKNDAN